MRTANLTSWGRRLAAAGLSLLGACSMEPRYRAPALPVPDQWPIPATAGTAVPAAAAGAGAGAAAAPLPVRDIGWREFFVDPRLQQLIALALTNNRDLRVAVINIQLARAQYKVQRASQLPALDAMGAFTREELPPSLTFGFPSPILQYYQAGIGITSFELDLFGRVRSLTHAALEQYLAQEQARRGAQLSLIAQVASAYLTLASDQELLRLSRETLRNQQDSFALTQKRHAAGAVSALDVAQAQTTVEAARADAARYEGNVAQDIDALTLLVGAPIDAALLPQQFEAASMGVQALPAELPSTVLLRRPDVLQAEHVLRAASADVGAARAAFFPTISLTANVGSASPQLSGLFQTGSGSWIFNPQATLPIFHGGALFGNLAATQAGRAVAVAQYEKAIQTGFREVADGLALSATLARAQVSQQALVDATSRAFELSQQRYRAGRDSYLSVLDAQRANYVAQQGLIATRLAQQSNRVTLYKALGGGWQEHSREQRTDD